MRLGKRIHVAINWYGHMADNQANAIPETIDMARTGLMAWGW